MNKIKVLIVDDHQVVRRGIINLFEDELDIEIVGEASDGIEAIEKIKELLPDIVLLDISMPKMGGLETVEKLTKLKSTAKIIVFSMHNNEEYIVKSIQSGAMGYVLKDTSKEELLSAIRKVFQGEKFFNSQISEIVINSISNKNRKTKSIKETIKLTKTEKLILSHIINGLNSREIAEKLDSSIRTIDNHRAHIIKKSNVKNTAELVMLSLKENLI